MDGGVVGVGVVMVMVLERVQGDYHPDPSNVSPYPPSLPLTHPYHPHPHSSLTLPFEMRSKYPLMCPSVEHIR